MDNTISAARLSELIGLIYDCAIDPACWPIAMEAIRVELDFHNATLDLIALPAATVLNSATCNITPEYRALMTQAGPDVMEQWGGAEVAMNLPLDRPSVLTRANPAFDADTSTNGYYVNFARPQGIVDVMAIGLARDAGAIGTLAFGRHRSAGPIGERETSVAQLLIPHLQRAATINRMLEGADMARATFSTTLDALGMPIVLVRADRTIVHANHAAKALLEHATLIRSISGVLSATTAAASTALAIAVAQALREGGANVPRASRGQGSGRASGSGAGLGAGSGLGLGIPIAAGRDAGALHVLPLPVPPLPGDRGSGVAAVFVAQVNTPFVAPTAMVAALFGLTATEARVFDHLVTGHTPATTATALGIGRSTVKTHLARLYDKIGVHRQADLVRVAAALAVPLTA